MRGLGRLRRRLGGLLARLMLERFLGWLSISVIALLALAPLGAYLGLGPAFRVGLLLALLSALPFLLLLPPPPEALELGLRRLDPESSFEAYLEAPPGPARELLRVRAERLSAALPGPRETRASLPRRLVALMTAAAACLVVAGAVSLIAGGSPLAGRGEGLARAAARTEEGSFAESGQDRPPAAGERGAEEETAGGDGLGGEGTGEEVGAGEGETGEGREAEAEEAPFERRRPEDAGGLSDFGAESGRNGTRDRAIAEGARELEEGGGRPSEAAPEGEGPGRERGSRSPEGRGKGYEASGPTGIPSPLLDYRARFFKALAERTGRKLSASGELGLGELAELERRYFGSFSLSVEVGTGEDPYEAMLRRRWRELRGGLR